MPDAPDAIRGARARLFAAVAALRASVGADPGRSRRENRAQDDPFRPVLTAVFWRFLDVWDPRAWDGGTVEKLAAFAPTGPDLGLAGRAG